MEVPTAQEKSKKIFFVQPKAHQFKFSDLNKTVPTDPLKLIPFFKQCQATNKAAGILKKIAKDKNQPEEKKQLILPSGVAVNQATSSIVATSITTIIKATDVIVMIANLTIVIKMINTANILVTTIRILKAASPTKRRMIMQTQSLPEKEQ
jgi:hypothetical protein